MKGTDWRTALHACMEQFVLSTPLAAHFTEEDQIDAAIFYSNGAHTFAPGGAETSQWTHNLTDEQVDAMLAEAGIDPTTGWR